MDMLDIPTDVLLLVFLILFNSCHQEPPVEGVPQFNYMLDERIFHFVGFQFFPPLHVIELAPRSCVKTQGKQKFPIYLLYIVQYFMYFRQVPSIRFILRSQS